MTITRTSPDDLLGITSIAAELDCSRSYVYVMMRDDPDFQPDCYLGRSPRMTRRKVDRKKRRLIEAHTGRRGPGRPRGSASPIAAE